MTTQELTALLADLKRRQRLAVALWMLGALLWTLAAVEYGRARRADREWASYQSAAMQYEQEVPR